MNVFEIFMDEIAKLAAQAPARSSINPAPVSTTVSSTPTVQPKTDFSALQTPGASGILPPRPTDPKVSSTKTTAQAAKVAENIRKV